MTILVCICVYVWACGRVGMFVCTCACVCGCVWVCRCVREVCVNMSHTAQGWTNLTLDVHDRVDSRFLVWPGSESTITEITEYIYLSPLKPLREIKYKSE